MCPRLGSGNRNSAKKESWKYVKEWPTLSEPHKTLNSPGVNLGCHAATSLTLIHARWGGAAFSGPAVKEAQAWAEKWTNEEPRREGGPRKKTQVCLPVRAPPTRRVRCWEESKYIVCCCWNVSFWQPAGHFLSWSSYSPNWKVKSFTDSQGKLGPWIHFSLEKACLLKLEKVIGEA